MLLKRTTDMGATFGLPVPYLLPSTFKTSPQPQPPHISIFKHILASHGAPGHHTHMQKSMRKLRWLLKHHTTIHHRNSLVLRRYKSTMWKTAILGIIKKKYIREMKVNFARNQTFGEHKNVGGRLRTILVKSPVFLVMLGSYQTSRYLNHCRQRFMTPLVL